MTLAKDAFNWEGTLMEMEHYCFVLKIPDHLKKEGISKIKIQANFYKVYFYSNGWFNSESPEVNYEEARKLFLKSKSPVFSLNAFSFLWSRANSISAPLSQSDK